MELHEEVKARLRQGFTLVQDGERHGKAQYRVLRPNGQVVRTQGHARPYAFTDTGDTRGHVYRAQVLKLLEDAGALKKARTQRTHTEADFRSLRKRPESPAKSGIVVAREILSDTNSKPRERGLAREYLKLMDNHQAIRRLAQKMGKRLQGLDN